MVAFLQIHVHQAYLFFYLTALYNSVHIVLANQEKVKNHDSQQYIIMDYVLHIYITYIIEFNMAGDCLPLVTSHLIR